MWFLFTRIGVPEQESNFRGTPFVRINNKHGGFVWNPEPGPFRITVDFTQLTGHKWTTTEYQEVEESPEENSKYN